MANKPLLLDLFCGAGGAAMGYFRAGFDVVGVDIKPQRHYPFPFVLADAMTFPIRGVDAVHASPPCQDHSALRTMHTAITHGTGWMLRATLDRLQAAGVPWVVENVAGAASEMSNSTILCGSMFPKPLNVRRHRLFASPFLILAPPCQHYLEEQVVGVYGHGQAKGAPLHRYTRGLPAATVADWREAMGIDWMNRDELSQAIPPAYTEFIGQQLLNVISSASPRTTDGGA